MKRANMATAMICLGLVAGCGSAGEDLPADELVEEAKAVVELAVDAGSRAHHKRSCARAQ